jgi:hypothetical protein
VIYLRAISRLSSALRRGAARIFGRQTLGHAFRGVAIFVSGNKGTFAVWYNATSATMGDLNGTDCEA